MQHRVRYSASLGLLLLAACTGAPAPQAPPPAAPEPRAEPPALVVTEEAPTVPDEPPLTPADFQDQTPLWVQDQLGPPTLVRRDGPVQVMLYQGNDCVLDITVRAATLNDYYRVHHMAARTPAGEAYDVAACLQLYQSTETLPSPP